MEAAWFKKPVFTSFLINLANKKKKTPSKYNFM